MPEDLILFPCEPRSPGTIDRTFAEEHAAARAAGFDVALYAHEAVVSGDLSGAVSGVPEHAGRPCVHRGWMLPGEAYASLYGVLVAKGLSPRVSPGAYEEAHYLPLAYAHLAADTARSAWITGDDPDAAWALYQREFAGGDALIKDWVKSAKERWHEACLLPAGTTGARFREIYAAFRERRGRRFNRGVVLREALPLATRGEDLRGFPLTDEVRLFFWRGELLVAPLALREPGRWRILAQRFASPFLALDVASLVDGRQVVIEAGDGGVSGLPPGLSPSRFYEALASRSGTR